MSIEHAPLPTITDRATFEARLADLRVQEKAHSRAGDAIAAARRRLPAVEVDPETPVIGADGPVTLLDTFQGRRQLIAYYFMWHPGRPAAEQCEGCTWNNSQVDELSYVHSRDITYRLMDLTLYGRQEPWEDSPEGWPRPHEAGDGVTPVHPFRSNGRPIAQWSRIEAGRSDRLTP